jgi:hypothetical protein
VPALNISSHFEQVVVYIFEEKYIAAVNALPQNYFLVIIQTFLDFQINHQTKGICTA